MRKTPDLFDLLGPENFEIIDHIELYREEIDGEPRWVFEAFVGAEPYLLPTFSLPGDLDSLRQFFDLLRRIIVLQEKCHGTMR